jgi:hypothetical protein
LATQKNKKKPGRKNKDADNEALRNQILAEAEIVARWKNDPFYIA